MSIKYNLRGTVLKSKKYHKSLEKSTDETWKKGADEAMGKNTDKVGVEIIVRKNITLPEDIYLVIKDYSIKSGISFSQAISQTSYEYIKKAKDLDLLNFLNNQKYVDKDEQEEIEKLNIGFSDTSGDELNIDDIL
jgi:hypothetical protein